MENIQNKNSFKKLLDRLQEDSWQLELLVSGFTIFGLLHAFEPVENAFHTALYKGDIFKDVFQVLLMAIFISILNLIIHLVIRSLWIGALGVRYISGEVEIDKLNYSKKFTNYLNKKVGSFDNYIENLEKLSSVIFAISFLLIFYVDSIFIILNILSYIEILNNDDSPIFIKVFFYIIQFLLVTGAALTFFDYLTQGLLKRNRIIANLYFPFYWVFSFLTLSFLYRPLYYNLIDNKFGRRISFFLFPFYFSVLFLVNTYKDDSGFIMYNYTASNSIRAEKKNYQDLIDKNKLFISILSIQSKVITEPYINVKIPLTKGIEKNILEFNTRLKQYQNDNIYKNYTFRSNSLSIPEKKRADSLHLEFVKTFQKVYVLKIDSIEYKPDFVIYTDIDKKNNLIGLETYIGTKNLAEGKHTLTYSRYKHPDTDSIITIKKIPFWYYKD